MPDSDMQSLAFDAAVSFVELMRFTGTGAVATIELAYRRAIHSGDTDRIANMKLELAELLSTRSDHEGARRLFDEARPMFRQVGAILGEANCIKSLGNIALARSDHEGARRLYDEARPMFRQVGDILGEANCIQRLGDIALRRSDHEGARRLYNEAREMYESIGEPYSIGWAHRKLASITFDAEGRRRHVNAARASWTSIDRPDLVDELDKEFPEFAPTEAKPSSDVGNHIV